MSPISLPFLQDLSSHDMQMQCIRDDKSDWITYAQFQELVSQFSLNFDQPGRLVFLYITNEIESVAAFLGALAANQSVAIIDPNIKPDRNDYLLKSFEPYKKSGQDYISQLAKDKENQNPTKEETKRNQRISRTIAYKDGNTFDLVKIKGDGNCFYHAVADQLVIKKYKNTRWNKL